MPAPAISARIVLASLATICKQCFNTVVEHPEQRTEALHIVRLAWRQYEAERAPLGVTAGMEPFDKLRRTLVVKALLSEVEGPPRDRPSASVI